MGRYQVRLSAAGGGRPGPGALGVGVAAAASAEGAEGGPEEDVEVLEDARGAEGEGAAAPLGDEAGVAPRLRGEGAVLVFEGQSVQVPDPVADLYFPLSLHME